MITWPSQELWKPSVCGNSSEHTLELFYCNTNTVLQLVPQYSWEYYINTLLLVQNRIIITTVNCVRYSTRSTTDRHRDLWPHPTLRATSSQSMSPASSTRMLYNLKHTHILLMSCRCSDWITPAHDHVTELCVWGGSDNRCVMWPYVLMRLILAWSPSLPLLKVLPPEDSFTFRMENLKHRERSPGHLDTWTSEHLDIWTPGHLDTWTPEHLNSWTSGYLDTWTMNIWTPRHLNTWTPRYLDIWSPEHLNTCKTEHLDTYTSTSIRPSRCTHHLRRHWVQDLVPTCWLISFQGRLFHSWSLVRRGPVGLCWTTASRWAFRATFNLDSSSELQDPWPSAAHEHTQRHIRDFSRVLVQLWILTRPGFVLI